MAVSRQEEAEFHRSKYTEPLPAKTATAEECLKRRLHAKLVDRERKEALKDVLRAEVEVLEI